tara:strand:+ start:2947 stop:3246 length:300 start_codon:yes stop_codon:yes gene_type:complete
MATVQKKENLTISIREYTDGQGQTKKVWKTIGELITWDDGKQSFEMWGPTGATKGSVFEQNEQGGQSQQQQAQQPQQYQQPQQAPQQAPQPHYQEPYRG